MRGEDITVYYLQISAVDWFTDTSVYDKCVVCGVCHTKKNQKIWPVFFIFCRGAFALRSHIPFLEQQKRTKQKSYFGGKGVHLQYNF